MPWPYAELIFAEVFVPAIGTHRSRGNDSSCTSPTIGSTRMSKMVSLRWPVGSPGPRNTSAFGSLASMLARLSEPMIR